MIIPRAICRSQIIIWWLSLVVIMTFLYYFINSIPVYPKEPMISLNELINDSNIAQPLRSNSNLGYVNSEYIQKYTPSSDSF